MSIDRDFSPGIWLPSIVTLRDASMSARTTRISRRSLPPACFVAVKSTDVPNSRNSIEVVPSDCGTRTGNSPPPRNRAGRPSVDTKAGSARIFATPFARSDVINKSAVRLSSDANCTAFFFDSPSAVVLFSFRVKAARPIVTSIGRPRTGAAGRVTTTT